MDQQPLVVAGIVARRRYRTLFRYGCHRGHWLVHHAGAPCQVGPCVDPASKVRAWDEPSRWTEPFRAVYPGAGDLSDESLALSLAWEPVSQPVPDADWPAAPLDRSHHMIAALNTSVPADVDVADVALKHSEQLPAGIVALARDIVEQWNSRPPRRTWIVNFEALDRITDALREVSL